VVGLDVAAGDGCSDTDGDVLHAGSIAKLPNTTIAAHERTKNTRKALETIENSSKLLIDRRFTTSIE
jgi:hypothetical protein